MAFSDCDKAFAAILAEAVIQRYEAVTASCKNSRLSPGEWTNLAAFVLMSQPLAEDGLSILTGAPSKSPEIEIVSLATGTKCIGSKAMSARGDVLNDSHAEVLARRGFLRFLYGELSDAKNAGSRFLEYCDKTEKFRLKPGWELHLIISHTPCGDASILPVKEHDVSVISKRKRRAEQELNPSPKKLARPREATIEFPGDSDEEQPVDDVHRTGAKCVAGSKCQDSFLPGKDYHAKGALRIKPGRGDRTLSMSCSDKIMKWNALGVQGALLFCLLDRPLYLSSIVIMKCPFDKDAATESLRGRARYGSVPAEWNSCTPNSPTVLQTDVLFRLGKRHADLDESSNWKASPKNVVWWRWHDDFLMEVLVNGRKLGATSKHSFQNRSALCKLELCRLFSSVQAVINLNTRDQSLWTSRPLTTYAQAKQSSPTYNAARRAFFSSFPDWVKKPVDLLHFSTE